MSNLNEKKQCVEEAFKELDWKYRSNELEEKCLFQTGVQLGEESKISKIMFNIEVRESFILITSICDIKADIDNITRMSEYVCRANWGLINGNFEYNYDNGNIRYKIYIDTEERQSSKKEIITSIIISVEMWSKYGNGLMDILGSDRSVKDIIESIENNKN